MTVLRKLDLFPAFRRFIDGLVHASASGDPIELHRHRSFIAVNLVGGLLALAALPIHLVVVGPTGLAEAGSLLWLAAPAPIALAVSQTGRLQLGHLLLAVSIGALIAWVALFTGGTKSLALIWLAVLPVEAALSGSRRVVEGVLMIGLAAVGCVSLAGSMGLLPTPTEPANERLLFALSAAGIAYMGLLAFRLDALSRISSEVARNREAHFRLMAENIGDMVTGHGPNGDVIFVSAAIERVMGMSPGEAHGDGLFRRVHVADRPAYLTAILDAATVGGAGTVEFRARATAPDGKPRHVWLEMRCRQLSEDDPLAREARVFAVMRDVTERKTQEEELLRAREQAEMASASKTRFLANVSHELRTPLNAIIGFSELLRTGTVGTLPDARQREYVQLIHDSGSHLLQVVNDILDMSKIESGAFDICPEPFDLPQLLENTRHMMAHQANERGLRINASIAPGLPEVTADRRACRQILINLLSNAIKFTNPGGSVTLGARPEGDRVAIFVRDTGIGISERDIARLGTPFMQADSGYDRKHEGTGLGLSVVKGLAALHGGTVEIESRLGEGTCVTVRIPVVAEAGHLAKSSPVRIVPLTAPERAAEAQESRQRRA
ncbi:sensor histidine kinase [Prosthecomicrobium sp. N25]|uniref:sensor histidine kinase n=1 Tax=Prosthecomicrobium sp. N25 TaxID=3129254 RepID=UPI0030775AF6